MDRQSTIGLVLIGVVLVIWMYFNAPEPQPIQDSKKTVKTEENKDSVTEKQEDIKSTKSGDSLEVKDESRVDELFYSEEKGEIVTIETDLIKTELTTKGAGYVKYFLKNYSTWYSKELPEDAPYYKKWVQLISKSKSNELNLVFVSKNGKLVNTKDIKFEKNLDNNYFKISGKDSLKIIFSYKFEGNKELNKIYTFYGDNFTSKFEVELINFEKVISGYRYDLVWENGLNFVEHNSVDEANYSNAGVYMGGENLIIDAKDEPKELNGKVDWLGIKNKYFGLIIRPLKPSADAGAFVKGRFEQNPTVGDREYYNASLKIPFNENAAYQKDEFQIYFGPMDFDLLKSYGQGYENFYDFGNFLGMKFITRPISEYLLLPTFKFLHSFIPNYGFVIIIFTLILKTALYPLSRKSLKSMRKMHMLQPKITELKEKYKDDPTRVQKETMNLYSTYGVNPMGGCLPMVMQMPILFALFTFFNVTAELRHQPFMLWIDNLSTPDILFTLPFSLPILGSHISGLAFFMGITMFIQQKMSIKDPTQKAMVYMMPVMLTLMFNSFAAGLNLYYGMFNLAGIAQQWWVNKRSSDTDLVPLDKPLKKGFMAKMMEAAEQKQKEQQNYNKMKKK